MDSSLDPLAAVFRCDDPGALSTALVGGEFEFLPLQGGAIHGTVRLLQAGGIAMQHAVLGPHVSRNALSRGSQTLLVPISHSAPPPNVNGTTVAAREALLIMGGVEFHCHCAGDVEWTAVLLPPGLLADAAAIAPAGAFTRGGLTRVTFQGDALGRLAEVLSTAGAFAAHAPNVRSDVASAQALGLSLQDLLLETLTAGVATILPSRAARDAQRVVLRAEEFLATRIGQPLYTSELCKALGVSTRKLHNAFVATVGRSPHAHLKARRLMLARRALQRGAGDPAQVKVVAYGHGFWHLGRFAVDYRRMFGETPSQTLAASRRSIGM